MAIDIHCHYEEGKAFVDWLKSEYAKKGHRACVNGFSVSMFKKGNWNLAFVDKTNAGVLKLARQLKETVIPFAYLNPDFYKPEDVDRFGEQGFKGLKMIFPKYNYDDERYLPFYEKAEKNRLPILFHTGLVSHVPEEADFGIGSARMQIIYLSTIASRFKKLNLIAAHFGWPLYQMAASLTFDWMFKNIFLDICGGSNVMVGMIKAGQLEPNIIKSHKMVYGLDWGIGSNMANDIAVWDTALANAGYDKNDRDMIFSKNTEMLLGLRK